MSLSEKERRILSRLEFQPDLSADEVGRQTRLKAATVSYTVRKLEDEGVIRQYGLINPFRLGYGVMAIYFSLMDQGQAQREHLVHRMLGHEKVVYVRSLLGDYHYMLAVLYRDLSEVKQTVREIFGGAGDVFSEKLLAPRVSVTLFSRKYFDSTMKVPGEFTLAPGSESVVLDDVDQKILSVVANDGLESLRQLSRTVDLPFSTLERRIKQLRTSGVIAGFFYRIRRETIGGQSYRLLLNKKAICAATQQKLLEYCKANPHVVYLIESLGAWDYEVGLETDNTSIPTKIVEELYKLCGMRVAWIKVLVDVERIKCSFFPFKVNA